MAIKITVAVDEATVERLARVAARTGQSKSAVIRAAVRDYEARADRLDEAERLQRLALLRRIAEQPPTRPEAEVTGELAEIRRVRRQSSRRHPGA